MFYQKYKYSINILICSHRSCLWDVCTLAQIFQVIDMILHLNVLKYIMPRGQDPFYQTGCLTATKPGHNTVRCQCRPWKVMRAPYANRHLLACLEFIIYPEFHRTNIRRMYHANTFDSNVQCKSQNGTVRGTSLVCYIYIFCTFVTGFIVHIYRYDNNATNAFIPMSVVCGMGIRIATIHSTIPYYCPWNNSAVKAVHAQFALW